MAGFIKLDDSPMFQKQISYLEQTTEELKDRCQILHKGCKKYMESLGDACIADSVFADYLEAFGGGKDDPLSVSIGGPIMSKFVTAFREIATFKELLRSQVEHVLVDRLSQFLSIDIQDTKDSRKRLDKAVSAYDQAREKFASLKKSARDEVVAELEEDLNNSKSAFERTRFSLVNSLMNIEAKKKHEFLESLSAIMDAHLRYFKLGYDLWSQMEPLIHQVLTYAQQCKEQATIEHDRLAKRIQEFRTESELKQLRVSSDLGAPTTYANINGVGMSSDKCIEEIMQSTKQGKVLTIKQGYLLKRSSHSKAGWKRRFFILDSRGDLYYLRNMTNKSLINQLHSSGSWQRDSHMLGKFRSRHYKAASYGEVNLDSHTIDLWTSTIKIDAEDKELRLCFRIISPMKTYTLQAESEIDRIDWMTKITGVIASLLNTHLQQQYPEGSEMHNNIAVACDGYDNSTLDNHGNTSDNKKRNQADSVSSILRRIPGNDRCAECSALDPDWASVNLGILICIECSGIHRNLGVHISKVRSITLDVKVWEPAILDLFRALGNLYCNSIWEDLLWNSAGGTETILSPKKPSQADAFHEKEKYIVEKYVKKSLVSKGTTIPSLATSIWEAVKTNNVREVYRLIVISDAITINTIYDEVAEVGLSHNFHERDSSEIVDTVKSNDPATCDKMTGYHSKPESCLHGCSLLHLACHSGNTVMLELLLQFGADINWCDYHGRTPLHHCICAGNNHVAKFLLRRGARASIKDGGGFGALERAMEIGAITDEELFVLLAECQ